MVLFQVDRGQVVVASPFGVSNSAVDELAENVKRSMDISSGNDSSVTTESTLASTLVSTFILCDLYMHNVRQLYHSNYTDCTNYSNYTNSLQELN